MSEEFVTMPSLDEKPYTEYLAGRAVRKVSPKRRHSLVQGALVSLLRQLARGRGDVGTEWRFHPQTVPPKTSLVPDVAFVSRNRLAALSEAEREEPPFAPDVAIEVRSPSDKPSDVVWKMRAYLGHGASVALDVVPEERTIRAFTHKGTFVFRNDDRFSSEELPWLAFDVCEAFADLAD